MNKYNKLTYVVIFVHIVPSGRRRVARDVCNKSFTARRYLRQHSQCHTGVTRPCPKCGRNFKFESSFSRQVLLLTFVSALEVVRKKLIR